MTELEEMKQVKQIWDWCRANKGDLPDMHILDVSNDYEDDIEFRIYHSKRYCIEVNKELIIIPEQVDHETIDGFYYGFSSDTWEGYDEISIEETIKLLGL